jgi:ABC-type dipeptide/oligopeptide/nickel transport system permease component
MAAYIIKRVLQLVPVIFVIICVNFVLVRLAPGDPITYLVGDAPVSREFIDELRAQYGLDQPLYWQLLVYLGRVLQGDLGYSFVSRDAVSAIILSRLPATLLLLGSQFVLSIIIGIALGVISAYRRGSPTDHAVSVISLVGFSVPAFWLGQMLMLVFALWLDLLPAQGMRSLRFDLTGWEAVLDVSKHLVLPTVTLTIFNLALIARVTRANMIDVLRMEYITYARSKGVPESSVVLVHALRNAILPVITVIGLNLRTLIAGAVLTETVFAWPGIGRLTYEAIFARDYPVLMGILIVIGITVVVANILTDIAYSWLDPRVRYQ